MSPAIMSEEYSNKELDQTQSNFCIIQQISVVCDTFSRVENDSHSDRCWYLKLSMVWA